MWTNSSQASISIHALREEGDYNPFVHTCFFGYFYPRPPRGGRLVEFCQLHQPVVFLSTPSARRATRNSYMFTRFLRDFYPRPPRGGRQQLKDKETSMSKFLSTPSARRATKTPKQEKSTKVISIHALREEGDGTRRPMVPKPSNFYPRPPRGGRPKATEAAEAKEYFYPRPPRGGRRTTPRYSNITKNFYPRPPRGGRPKYGAWATSS